MITKPALDPNSIIAHTSTVYPPPFDKVVHGRAKRALTQELGLTQFGANLTELAPGTASALRHWHSHEDEFVYVLKGEVVLITDGGEQTLTSGQCAGFPAGVPDGHCFVNKSSEPVIILEVGSRDLRDEGNYPDVDLHAPPGRYERPYTMTRKNGEPIT